MDVVGSGREAPARRLPPSAPLIALALLLVATGATAELRSAQDVDLRIVSAAAGATPGATGDVQDAAVDLTVRNTGAFAVEVVDQRLDRGGPVDRVPAPALAAGATAVLALRWRVLCAEVGTLFGPRSLDLTVRPARGGARQVSVALRPAVRQAFRTAASSACAP